MPPYMRHFKDTTSLIEYTCAKNAYPKSYHDESSDKRQMRDIRQHKWLVIFKNVNVIKKKKKGLQNVQSQIKERKKIKEIEKFNAMHDPGRERGRGNATWNKSMKYK